MPKVIKPTLHSLLDYAVAGTFLMVAAAFWPRNRRAAIGSALCAGAVVANNIFTDYPGGVAKVMNYKSHGRIDAGLAGITATLPRLMGFADEPEAKFFGRQALVEITINSLTDFDAYDGSATDRLPYSHEEDTE